jgi:transglutaminase-like putative cysteine protease
MTPPGSPGRMRASCRLWMFERVTRPTKPGPLARKFVAGLPHSDNALTRLHALSQAIHDAVPYQTGTSALDWTTEDVLANSTGVCQDHAHVFLTCARLMGHPARYVSGYLMLDDRIEQEATHAWAEAWLPELGWVGFDISNAISPDTRYVRIATGLDYFDAAPVSGMRFGQSSERMSVVGLVFMSDTRTNAGVDNVSTYRKLFSWQNPGHSSVTIMTAGNLATTQSVVSMIEERMKAPATAPRSSKCPRCSRSRG